MKYIWYFLKILLLCASTADHASIINDQLTGIRTKPWKIKFINGNNITHNLTNDKKMYHAHVVAHVQQLNLTFIEVIINHISKVLKEKDMMQSMQTIKTKLFFLCFFVLKRNERRKKKVRKNKKLCIYNNYNHNENLMDICDDDFNCYPHDARAMGWSLYQIQFKTLIRTIGILTAFVVWL